jgi:thiamine-phosphate pyrophosphorylase
MRPLPRLHAFTDPGVLEAGDFGVRAAAIAAGGSAVALHARDRDASGAVLTSIALHLLALARPPEAAVFVSGRADIAAATGAQGIQLNDRDLLPADVRRILPRGWIGRSVHSAREAAVAVDEGADFLVVGSVYATPSHPDRAPAGPALVRETAKLGIPVIAIGGMTPERAAEVRAEGAYGVAAIRALWTAPDPAAATLAFLSPWASVK